MRKYMEIHKPWRKNRFVLEEEVVEIIDANGTRIKVLAEVSYLHHLINAAILQAQISFQFNRMKRKS